MKTESKTYANHADEIQDQMLAFNRRVMRRELKEVFVKCQFMKFKEDLLEALPGSIDTIEMLALLEGAEALAIESVKNEIWDGL